MMDVHGAMVLCFTLAVFAGKKQSLGNTFQEILTFSLIRFQPFEIMSRFE
jgi:hypothetical protein